MRRSRDTALCLVALVLLAAACGGGGSSSDKAEPTTSTTASGGTTTAPPTTRSTAGGSTSVPPTSGAGMVVFHAYNVRVFNSEESDNAFRVIVHSFAVRVTVTVRAKLPTPNNVLRVCPAASLAGGGGGGATCQTPASGVPVQVVHGSSRPAVEVVQAGVSGPGSAGQSITLDEVAIEYQAAERAVQVRLPPLGPAAGASVCKDNGCSPFFEITPFRSGAFSGKATWTAEAGNATPPNGQLTVETGGIAAHELNRSGRSYRVVASAQGGPGISVSGTLPTPVEAALALRNTGSSNMIDARLDFALP